MARLLQKEFLSTIGSVNTESFLSALLSWQDELSEFDWDDCTTYSTIDSVIDIFIDNLEEEC